MRILTTILITAALAACTAGSDPAIDTPDATAPSADAAPAVPPPGVTSEPQRIGNFCLVVGCQTGAECTFMLATQGDGSSSCCLYDGTCARAVDIGGGECFPPGPVPDGELCPNDANGDGMCVSADLRWYSLCPWQV
jgi:hypothetical protein